MLQLLKKYSAIIRGLIVFGLAFSCMIEGAMDSRFDGDSVRDILRARDCLEGFGTCHDLQIDAQAKGLHHGPLWRYFLIANLAVGLDPVDIAVVVVVLLALSTAVIDFWVGRYFSKLFAPVSAVLWMEFISEHFIAIIWNPMFSYLPLTVFLVGVSRLIERRSVPWLIISGLCLYWCIDAHVSYLFFVPVLVGVTMVSGTFKDTAVSLTALAVPAALFSWGTYAINLGAGVGLRFLLAGSIVATGVVAVLCRPIWTGISTLHRQSAVVVSVVLVFLAVKKAAQWRTDLVFHDHYLNIISPALVAIPAVAWANLVDLVGRWWSFIRAKRGVVMRLLTAVLSWGVAVAVFYNLDNRVLFCEMSSYARITETRILAEHFKAKGLTYDVLRQRLFGPSINRYGFPLLALGVYSDRPPGPPTMAGSKQVRLVRAFSSWLTVKPPPSWERVDLPHGRVALISLSDGWLRMRPVKIEIDGKPAPQPLPDDYWYNPEDHVSIDSYTSRIWFAAKMFTVEQLGKIRLHERSPRQISVVLPIEIGDDAPEHVIDMIDEGDGGWKHWTVESVEGVSHEIGPGGDYVILRSNGPRSGTMKITSSGTQWNELPLNVFETTPAEKDIRELVLKLVDRKRYSR